MSATLVFLNVLSCYMLSSCERPRSSTSTLRAVFSREELRRDNRRKEQSLIDLHRQTALEVLPPKPLHGDQKKKYDTFLTDLQRRIKEAPKKPQNQLFLNTALLEARNKDPMSTEGLWMKFGVDMSCDAGNCNKLGPLSEFYGKWKGGDKVYGFDWFSGLPERWRAGFGAGIFGGRKIPNPPPNVKWVVGKFQETLPKFMEEHRDKPVSYLLIDSDIYASAKFILDTVGPRLSHDAIVYFDELINFDDFDNGEVRALYEYLSDNNIDYDVVMASSDMGMDSGHHPEYEYNQQVAVRLKKNEAREFVKKHVGSVLQNAVDQSSGGEAWLWGKRSDDDEAEAKQLAAVFGDEMKFSPMREAVRMPRKEEGLSSGADANFPGASWGFLTTPCLKQRIAWTLEQLDNHGCARILEIGGYLTPIVKDEHFPKHGKNVKFYVNVDPSVTKAFVDVFDRDGGKAYAATLPVTLEEFVKNAEGTKFDCVVMLGSWRGQLGTPEKQDSLSKALDGVSQFIIESPEHLNHEGITMAEPVLARRGFSQRELHVVDCSTNEESLAARTDPRKTQLTRQMRVYVRDMS